MTANVPPTSSDPAHHAAGEGDELSRLRHAIEHASHVLPAQGPITVFIHHNTLHAFEDLPFTEGVKKGAAIFGCQPFLTEERYREALRRGRVRFIELEAVLRETLGDAAEDLIVRQTTRLDLRLAMLQYPLRFGPTEELLWHVAETDALKRFRNETSDAIRARLIAETRRWVMRDLRGGSDAGRSENINRRAAALDPLFERYRDAKFEDWLEDDWEEFTLHALWRVCCDGVDEAPAFTPAPLPAIRHRDLLMQVATVDSDVAVNDRLIRFCAAFLDQGFAVWNLPERERGFYTSFLDLYRRGQGPPERWLRGMPDELERLIARQVGPMDSIRESLTLLGVAETEWDHFLSTTFLALRGWGGMIQQVEERGDRVAQPIPNGSLIEFLAVRLILDRFSVKFMASEALGFSGPLSDLRAELRSHLQLRVAPSTEQVAFLVFQLAQVLGWSPNELHKLNTAQWLRLVEEIETFSAIERRQVFHLAYERRFLTQTLDAFLLHSPRAYLPENPRFQVITCLDEREESFRRHLEEVAPDVETFGVAGFFAVPMYYRGATEAQYVPLCPIVIRPRHWVCEEVDEKVAALHHRRAKTRRLFGALAHRFHTGSRSFLMGILAAALGVLALAPLTARVLFPRMTASIRSRFDRVVRSPGMTRLKLERQTEEPGQEEKQIGFTVAEMITMAERMLRDIGLISGFSRLVFSIGHGSFSVNNPHKSAYDCGACGGSPGAPNGRAVASILNDPRVRAGLVERGINIPPQTWFVGCSHNTCDDSLSLFDVDRIPQSLRPEFQLVLRDLSRTCDRNAHERSRRFMSAPLTMSFPSARQHVEARSEDLAQTRPELGHATNAICQVGRRRWTRGLYLDRRAFLTSYDPTQDDAQGSILERTLSAVFPVCGGINLEYYFSHVDSPGYGCGTKLPHNVTSLLGVMDGAASDLRTGLPWQMVEIHEPVRLLLIIETRPEILIGIMNRVAIIGRMARNGWVQVAVQDPETARIKVFQNGTFIDYKAEAELLPQAESSADWYGGWREHLEFAEIQAS